MSRTMKILTSQRGVAMVTVLFVGATLTVLASAATFSTIREFRQGGDDRRAAQAISIAEAGIDRLLGHIRSGLLTYEDLNEAGCPTPLSLPLGSVGPGTFSVSLRVYNPNAEGANRFPPAACSGRPTSPHPGMGSDLTWFVVTSRGVHPDASRTVQQIIALRPIGLPIGIYAHSISVQSANHPVYTVSLVSETTITNRERLGFVGFDSYYKVQDFFSGATGRSLSEPVHAAAHAASGILLKPNTNYEFANSNLNCTANSNAGDAQQSVWDSDGSDLSGPITAADAAGCGVAAYPNSSVFAPDQLGAFSQPELSEEDHAVLKESAKLYGVYCSFAGTPVAPGDSAANDFCYMENVHQGTNKDYMTMISGANGGGTGGVQSRRNNFVAYFEFRNGAATNNNITRTGTVWGCTDTDGVAPNNNKSILVVVRRGGVDYSGAGGHKINGAFIIDGNWTSEGDFEFNGTIVAGGNVHFQSSAQKYSLDACWVDNMPGPFLEVVPGHWSEIDR